MNHLISPAIEQQLRTLGIASQAFHLRVDALLAVEAPRLGRLWSYYRNPARPSDASDATSSPYRQAQEWGLPRRIKGDPGAADSVRREVVIENDIGWRIDTMVDFLFGKELMISSTAPDEGRRRVVTQLLRAIFTNHGGPAFL
ncbi:MAG TPA: hypothetical protein PLD59_16945, partial [Tepidisphaeraceae bacterium]|nr:hypothetical protein [Tepidisphaeraceae bacterium]